MMVLAWCGQAAGAVMVAFAAEEWLAQGFALVVAAQAMFFAVVEGREPR